MLSSKQIEALQPAIRTLQIICAAMVGGIILFGVLIVVVSQKEMNQSLEFLPLMGLGLAVVGACAAIIYPAGFRKTAARQLAAKSQSPEHKVVGAFMLFQTSKIIGMALFEGPAFFNLVVWMMEGSVYNLGAVIALTVIMVLGFPTSANVVPRIESMLDNAGDESR